MDNTNVIMELYIIALLAVYSDMMPFSLQLFMHVTIHAYLFKNSILNNPAPVWRLDNAIQRISVSKTNHAIHWTVIYPVDSIVHFSNNQGLVSRKACKK